MFQFEALMLDVRLIKNKDFLYLDLLMVKVHQLYSLDVAYQKS